MKEKILAEAPELTRVSSRGQVVIPKDIRGRLHIKEGSIFAVSSINGDMVVMKKLETPLSREDIETAMEINNAWKEMERGEFRKSSIREFRKELKGW